MSHTRSSLCRCGLQPAMSWAHCKFSTSQESFEESDVKLLGLAASFSASALAAQKLRQEAEAGAPCVP